MTNFLKIKFKYKHNLKTSLCVQNALTSEEELVIYFNNYIKYINYFSCPIKYCIR